MPRPHDASVHILNPSLRFQRPSAERPLLCCPWIPHVKINLVFRVVYCIEMFYELSMFRVEKQRFAGCRPGAILWTFHSRLLKQCYKELTYPGTGSRLRHLVNYDIYIILLL